MNEETNILNSNESNWNSTVLWTTIILAMMLSWPDDHKNVLPIILCLFHKQFYGKEKAMDEEVYMLTTEDNPFSPFTQFDRWYSYDTHKGYHTLSYLARLANTSSELSFEDNLSIINSAINDIVAVNALGIYKKVKESDYAPQSADAEAKEESLS